MSILVSMMWLNNRCAEIKDDIYFENRERRIGWDKLTIFFGTISFFVLKLCRIVDDIMTFWADTDLASQDLSFL